MSDLVHKHTPLVENWVAAPKEDCAVLKQTIIGYTAWQLTRNGNPCLICGIQSTVVSCELERSQEQLLPYPMVYMFRETLLLIRSAKEISSSRGVAILRL